MIFNRLFHYVNKYFLISFYQKSEDFIKVKVSYRFAKTELHHLASVKS